MGNRTPLEVGTIYWQQFFFRMCYSNGADNFMGYRQNPSKLIEVGITFWRNVIVCNVHRVGVEPTMIQIDRSRNILLTITSCIDNIIKFTKYQMKFYSLFFFYLNIICQNIIQRQRIIIINFIENNICIFFFKNLCSSGYCI